MRLLVVGAGATGGYFGAVAARGGAETTFVARGRHGDVMRERGVRVTGSSGEFEARPRVISRIEDVAGERYDTVLVTVKMADLGGVLQGLGRVVINEGGAVIMGQNGVEAEEIASRYIPPKVLCGAVLVIGVAISEPGILSHHGLSSILVGAHKPEADPAARRAALELSKVGITASYAADLKQTKWIKLVWNNAFNTLTALTGLGVSQVANDSALRELALRSMREVEAIARAQGIPLPERVVEMCLAQGQALGDVSTSMLQDVKMGRPLEHDALSGVIVRLGKKFGVATPVNDVLLPLLAAISSRNSASSTTGKNL